MSTTIAAVTGTNNISSCILVNLNLDGNVYYISSAYKPITYNGNTYTELGSFLTLDTFREDIRTTNGDLTLGLSGIPSEQNYMSLILNSKVKGGEISIYRAFFDENTLELQSGEVYLRFKGIITNFAITEDIDTFSGDMTNGVSVTCASINTILENRTSGQRTNPEDRARFYANDAVFDRVPELYNISFDFGKEYKAGGGGYGRGGGAGGGGGRGPGDDNRRRFQER